MRGAHNVRPLSVGFGAVLGVTEVPVGDALELRGPVGGPAPARHDGGAK